MTGERANRAKGRVRKSIVYSFWDGCFAAVQLGVVEQFVTPAALFLGANHLGVGFLNFVRNSLVAVVQVCSADLTARLKSRKKLITWTVLLGALMWLPTFFLPFLFVRWRVPLFIVLFGITSALNMLATPAWASLMTEYLPASKRGRYFGWRGTVLGIVYLASVLLAGVSLHFFGSLSLWWAFGGLFIAAALSRFVSWIFLTRMYEPPWRGRLSDYFSFGQFLGRIRQSNFARFAVFSAGLMSSVALVSPFFAVYLLRELHFDYLTYTVVTGAAVLTTYLTPRYWGEFADRYGNMRIIRVTSLLVSLLPLLWLLSRDVMYLVVVQLWGGFIWAGLNLASVNFIYDAAMQAKRERCVAYFNFLSGVGIGVGALAGGALFRFLPPFLGSRFFSLLLLSALLRIVFSFCLRFFTREVRPVEPAQPGLMLYDMSGIRAIGLLGKVLLTRQRPAPKGG